MNYSINVNELKTLVAKLTNQIAIAEERAEKEKQAQLKETKYNAVAEQRARISQFCKKHKIAPTQTERDNLYRIVEILETKLLESDPNFRYNPRSSVKSGARDISQRAWKRPAKKGKKDAGEQPKLPF